jgi:hypothetical protein
MPSDSDNPDDAAARLEAALERIAAAAARAPGVAAEPDTTLEVEAPSLAPQVVARLDRLIDRLRGALAGPTH